ncbi:class I SAM-dependent methyltransferase [Catenulispora subtropica]|uniref:Methyltransferase domain-containing protein n=1 Tax=Catenulispora subtropica TaxID=450798 RepID=A0ABN2SKC6_9ACTN
MTHAGVDYWNSYFRELRQAGDDLDWGEEWVAPFIAPLSDHDVRRLLELGCGSGNDAMRIAQHDIAVTAVDLSTEAIGWARERYGSMVDFMAMDISGGLPFVGDEFDAVMSNVALHMFGDEVTRAIFAEVRRVTRPGGLFLFHVNAVEDRQLREARRPVARELEENYVLEQSGQTVRFFSQAYLRELLSDWADVELALVEILDPDTGQAFKRVWRGIARR